MRRVYAQAKEVLIWLGGEDEDTEVALRLAAYIDVTQQQQGPVNEELFRIINDAAMTFSMSPPAARDWIQQFYVRKDPSDVASEVGHASAITSSSFAIDRKASPNTSNPIHELVSSRFAFLDLAYKHPLSKGQGTLPSLDLACTEEAVGEVMAQVQARAQSWAASPRGSESKRPRQHNPKAGVTGLDPRS
jgi:hypothetical protein